jgi:hypothetical protein
MLDCFMAILMNRKNMAAEDGCHATRIGFIFKTASDADGRLAMTEGS